MNWYKTSKLIDKKAPTDEKSIVISCQYCHRFATHPEDETAGRDSYTWKKYDELDPEEYFAVKKSLLDFNVSHGICPHCWKILEEHKHNITPNKVRALSLEGIYEN